MKRLIWKLRVWAAWHRIGGAEKLEKDSRGKLHATDFGHWSPLMFYLYNQRVKFNLYNADPGWLKIEAWSGHNQAAGRRQERKAQLAREADYAEIGTLAHAKSMSNWYRPLNSTQDEAQDCVF